MRPGSFLFCFAALALLTGAFRAHYLPSLSSLLLTLVLIALCAAIALHVRFLLLVHREHEETAKALVVTEREYKSVFDSALDAILILDNEGVCLDANQAALNLFRTSREGLVGESVERFFSGTGEFHKAWHRFLDRKSEYRDTRVRRGDGTSIFVEYTARAYYMPGRHLAVVRDISWRKQAEAALRESEERFQQMASNIEEIFWMLDARTWEVLYVNPAYQTITGRRPTLLFWKDPKSYQDVIHPEDRARVLSRLRKSADTGDRLDEEFRILRPDNHTRWVWIRGFPVRDSAGNVLRLVGTVQDISGRKSAEAEMARNLALAESSREEAEAFRRTSLALTENLSMDYVLDTLLQSLLKLIPCESARVLLVEADTRLFLAREAQNSESSRAVLKFPKTLDAKDSSFLMHVLVTRNSLLIPNTAEETEWASFRGFSSLRSWLCVPLVASQQVLGMLSLGDARERAFTPEHLRIAKSLAIPAAVAIQNARLYERAAIYGAELEQRLADLQTAEQALRVAEQSQTISEGRFAKVFRSSPIASSITTAEEGLFVDVNHAFERRYGYCREQLIGRTVFDVGIWDDPNERHRMLSEIREQGRVRHRMTCFRNGTGELLETMYSAETIELDGRECLLTVSLDMPNPLHTESLLRQRSTHKR
jgi:PAS domain S-box-containing protein